MKRLAIAELALVAIFWIERLGGDDAFHLGQALRMVVGSWIGHGFAAVLNDLECNKDTEGFVVLTQQHLDDLRDYRMAQIPNQKIEHAKREIAAIAMELKQRSA